MNESPRPFFDRLHIAALVILFVAAIAIRLYDLTDLPLDFHPTRQLFSALKARGMYYQSLPDAPAELRAFAIQQGKMRATIEPEILERLTAFTWQFSGEQLWVARIYSILFWLTGGIFVYLLARDLFNRDGALFATAFYLFLPYTVMASRSFQPDPLMTALVISFWWAVNRWARRGEWKWVILASLFGGLAIFVKLNAAFFVIGGALGAALGRASLRELIREKQVWAMALLGILPGAAWVAYGLSRGFLGQQFGGRFMPELFFSPSFYLGWAEMLNNVIGLIPFALALIGLLLVGNKSTRSLLPGLWGAYLAFALFFNYHISTHDYYSLPLIPIAALSLTPIAEAVFSHLAASVSTSRVKQVFAIVFISLGLLAAMWESRAALKSSDYRPAAMFWEQVGETVRDHRVVALTQEYGLPLAYWGWVSASNWPDSTDIVYHDLRGGGQPFDKLFTRLTNNKELFLVTDLADLARQPELQTRLSQFAVFAEGDGYIVYDLRQAVP